MIDLMILGTLVIVVSICVVYFFFFVFLPLGLPFVPSRKKTVQDLLSILGDISDKRILDLGSGDGRIVLACAGVGAHATGYEINPFLVWWSLMKIRFFRLSDKAIILRKDFWSEDLSEFDIVIFYGVSYLSTRLENKVFGELKQGAKAVTLYCKFPSSTPLVENGPIFVYQNNNNEE